MVERIAKFAIFRALMTWQEALMRIGSGLYPGAAMRYIKRRIKLPHRIVKERKETDRIVKSS